MGIRFTCTDCGKTFDVEDQWAGKRVKCKVCGNVLQIPSLPAAKPRAVPPPLPRRESFSPDQPPQDDEGIPPNLIKLIAGILLIGLIACVWVFLSNKNQPATTPVAIPQVNSPSNPSFSFSDSSATPKAPAVVSNIQFPDDRKIKMMIPGVEIYPMIINGTGPGIPMHVRLYLPANRHEAHSLPCVFIAPAGTRMLYGSELGDGDNPEHLPYARQGFAVLAYELSGDMPEDHNGRITFGQLKGPVQQFLAADGGLANARTAVDFVLAKVPEVDSNQLFAAGHSSAATMALNAVEADHRFRAVAAYAPACDVVTRWGNDLPKLNRVAPGASDWAERLSPLRHVNDISCPVLLFHADDDTNVKTQDIEPYLSALQSAGKTVIFQHVPAGGHYQSMIDEGIPAGIEFFKAQGAKPLPPILH
jgi:dienelactone hydrolase